MSERIDNTFSIASELPQQCDDCGEIRELRPYGPYGSDICYECAMKDPEGTAARYDAIITGVEVVSIDL